MDGYEYSSVEHAYQAAKTISEFERSAIRAAESAGKAKRLGKAVTIRHDWNEIKLSVMSTLVSKKFSNAELGRKLMETGQALLIEGNTWGDVFWGVCNGKGQNRLGLLLMEAREVLRGSGPFSAPWRRS